MGKHRNDPNMEKPDRDPDTELTFQFFRLLNRVVSLLGWLLIPLVLTVVLLELILVVMPVFVPATDNFKDSREEAHKQIENLMHEFSPLAPELWKFLAPLLSFVIVIAVFRWLLFSKSSDALRIQIAKLAADVPSFIAILVLFAVCLLPLTGIALPEAISNIALVIVGFYFGTKRPNSDNHEGPDKT